MTKKLIMIGMVLLLAVGVMAQESSKGISAKGFKAGLNMSDIREEEIEGAEAIVTVSGITGFVVGGYITYDLSPTLAIQPELLYSRKGAKMESNFDDSYYKSVLSYLELPILIKYQFGSNPGMKPNLYAGPAIAYLLTGTNEYKERDIFTGEETTGTEDITHIDRLDYGLAVGGGVGVAMGQNELLFDIRYTYGLNNWEQEEDDAGGYNTAISFTVGYSF